MKKVKGKYIRLTEEQLNKIIKENIDRSIKRIISEYAEPRQKFINRIDNLLPQIVINWCLVHYCTITNEDVNRCKNHWRNELRSAIINACGKVLKGNNSIESRKKAINEAIEYSELLTNPSMAFNIVADKFETENIQVKNNTNLTLTIQHLIDNKDSIVEIMAINEYNNIIDYINNI